MNDGRFEIRDDLKRAGTEGPVSEQPGKTHEQGTPVDTQVYIRTATPSDRARLRRMFSRASTETVNLRFHLPYPEVPERKLGLMLDADHHAKEALVAVVGEEIVGHTMYVRHGEGSEAEMAIVVEDGWQSMGVGKSLLSELAQIAKSRGIETLTGEVLGTNRRMLGLAAKFAGTGYTINDDVYHIHLPLRMLQPTERAARTPGRAA